MNKDSDRLIRKFIEGQRLKNDEFILVDKFLNDIQYKKILNLWLEENWQQSQSEDVKLQFNHIREKIGISSLKTARNRMLIFLYKAAAILFIPLFTALIYFYFNQNKYNEFLALTTQKGEQTSVILPDGSKAWLNVDTKLSYPVNFGVKSRKLKLEGEAYFEVEKNHKLNFEVTSDDVIIRATGTSFIVSAYPENSIIKSSLIEGSVEVKYGSAKELLKPGQQLIYNKKDQKAQIKTFDEDYELAWKNKQLIFQLTPFEEVITELEKWFNVTIEYDPVAFKSETLTVHFEKYESLEKILNVIARASGFKFTVNRNNIKIIK